MNSHTPYVIVGICPGVELCHTATLTFYRECVLLVRLLFLALRLILGDSRTYELILENRETRQCIAARTVSTILPCFENDSTRQLQALEQQHPVNCKVLALGSSHPRELALVYQYRSHYQG